MVHLYQWLVSWILKKRSPVHISESSHPYHLCSCERSKSKRKCFKEYLRTCGQSLIGLIVSLVPRICYSNTHSQNSKEKKINIKYCINPWNSADQILNSTHSMWRSYETSLSVVFIVHSHTYMISAELLLKHWGLEGASHVDPYRKHISIYKNVSLLTWVLLSCSRNKKLQPLPFVYCWSTVEVTSG